MYYVYILASRRHGTLYIGVTNSLQKRLEEHRNGKGSSFVVDLPLEASTGKLPAPESKTA